MKTPLLAVDIVICHDDEIVLIRRDNPPFQGFYALPGGFVEVGESAEEAASREALEETGLNLGQLQLVGVYSKPGRDPRGHVVSICYLAEGRGQLRAGSDARSVHQFPLANLPALAFDHSEMIEDAISLMKRRPRSG